MHHISDLISAKGLEKRGVTYSTSYKKRFFRLVLDARSRKASLLYFKQDAAPTKARPKGSINLMGSTITEGTDAQACEFIITDEITRRKSFALKAPTAQYRTEWLSACRDAKRLCEGGDTSILIRKSTNMEEITAVPAWMEALGGLENDGDDDDR